jgi:hypothetical protein
MRKSPADENADSLGARIAAGFQVDKEKIDLKNPVDSGDYDRRTPLHLAARRVAAGIALGAALRTRPGAAR